YDGGAYAKAFIEGVDQHWQTATAPGLAPFGMQREKANKVHTIIREGAKRFRYGFLFGAGGERLGRIIADTTRTMVQADATTTIHRQIFGDGEHPVAAKLKQVGKQALNKFMAATPGLRDLRTRLEDHARKHEWLPGLDGRRVPVRALYTTLN